MGKDNPIVKDFSMTRVHRGGGMGLFSPRTTMAGLLGGGRNLIRGVVGWPAGGYPLGGGELRATGQRPKPAKAASILVGAIGFEPMTSTV